MAREKKGGEKVRTTTPTIVMEDGLWTELRMQALREKTSASEIIRRLVSDYLKKTKKKGDKYGN
jgi:predicted CopG family antitoxin